MPPDDRPASERAWDAVWDALDSAGVIEAVIGGDPAGVAVDAISNPQLLADWAIETGGLIPLIEDGVHLEHLGRPIYVRAHPGPDGDRYDWAELAARHHWPATTRTLHTEDT